MSTIKRTYTHPNTTTKCMYINNKHTNTSATKQNFHKRISRKMVNTVLVTGTVLAPPSQIQGRAGTLASWVFLIKDVASSSTNRTAPLTWTCRVFPGTWPAYEPHVQSGAHIAVSGQISAAAASTDAQYTVIVSHIWELPAPTETNTTKTATAANVGEKRTHENTTTH
jgi:hypothetical protein